MKDNIVKDKSFEFAIKIMELYKFLCEHEKEFVMSKQLLLSDASIGANTRESKYAESRLDFIHKLSISSKGTNKSGYWLELLNKSNYFSKNVFDKMNIQLIEILKLLTAIIKLFKNHKSN